MRVTQSMLSSNMLRNLNNSYNKMAKYQEQLTSGTIINRPSDDPVVAVKGMGYRVDLDKNQQYQRNLNQAHSWLDGTDEALDQVGTSLIRVKELIVQAANDTNTTEDRQKINQEIAQIKQHLQDLANTKIGENYIFSGTKTGSALFVNDPANPANPDKIINEDLLTGAGGDPADPQAPGNKAFEINVFDGISMQINTSSMALFGEINAFMTQVETVLNNPAATSEEIGNALGIDFAAGGNPAIPGLDALNEQVLVKRADVGARQNRVELMESRLQLQEVNVTKQMSQNEDTDYAKTISEMVTAESIHQASLSVGAKIIQQTLVDFIR